MTAIIIVAAAFFGLVPQPDARDTLALQERDTSALQEQVREAERAFARTMADRNHAEFVGFLADEAIFLGPDRTLRGRADVADGWKPFFAGPKPPFSWEPERVEVVASGRLAISTGPVFDPEGKRVGTFTSTWRREEDGRWRVVLDSGCPPCRCP